MSNNIILMERRDSYIRARANTYTYAGSRNSIPMQAGNRNMSITTCTHTEEPLFPRSQ